MNLNLLLDLIVLLTCSLKIAGGTLNKY